MNPGSSFVLPVKEYTVTGLSRQSVKRYTLKEKIIAAFKGRMSRHTIVLWMTGGPGKDKN
jgi:hypothetical protein